MQRDELERIYDEHALCAYALFQRFTNCEADARDLLQDWLVQIAEQVDSTTGLVNERAFFLRIAYRKAVDWTRRGDARSRKHKRSYEELESQKVTTIEEVTDGIELQKALETSMELLPKEQQLVVQMKLWDELTFSDIAEVLDVSPNTVASRYRYGIAKLQESLRSLYEEAYN